MSRRCILEDIMNIIENRLEEKPEGSYTVELASRGQVYIARKVGEEAVEVVVASLREGRERLVQEAVDLIYHLLVLLVINGISIDELRKEVYSRMGGKGDG